MFGYRIFGSPYINEKKNKYYAFSITDQKDILNKWEEIPSDTDILITHGPPFG